MTVATYGTVRSVVQSTVHNLLKADSSVTDKCSVIIDGIPSEIIKRRGTYISVNTPTTSHPNLVLSNTKTQIDITLPITIGSKKESVVRDLIDLVISSLRTNQSTTRTTKLKSFKIKNQSTNTIDEEGSNYYLSIINVGYIFTG